MKFEELMESRLDEGIAAFATIATVVMKIVNEIKASRAAKILSNWYPTMRNDINDLMLFVKHHERKKQPIDDNELRLKVGNIRRRLMNVERSDVSAPHLNFVNERLKKIEKFASRIGVTDDRDGRFTKTVSPTLRKVRRYTL